MLGRWQCTHLGATRKTAAFSGAGANGCVSSLKKVVLLFSHVKDRGKAVMCNHRNNIQCAANKHVYMKHLGIRMVDSRVNIYCRIPCLFQVS